MTPMVSLRSLAQACKPPASITQTAVTRHLLAFAALTFWVSWFLMPDPGTTDARHILAIVKGARTSVLGSVLVQITSTVAYLAALFLLVRVCRPQSITMAGIVLFGIGVMGLCADAFFHLLAYEMTSASVVVDDNVVRVMHLMQTEGVVVLLPILLPFFIGSLVLAIGLGRQAAISWNPAYVFAAAFVVGIVGTVIATFVVGYQGRAVTLAALGLFAVGHAMIGQELAASERPA